MEEYRPQLTMWVNLNGGQDRLRQLILYVAKKCEPAKRFGGIKLNKILWKADFDSFAARQVPVTGRRYQRERFGPVPREMRPLHREMQAKNLIRVELVDFGDDIVEHRTVALVEPDLRLFSKEDLRFVDQSIAHYWNMTGMESSDDSHGLAWKTRRDGAPMPYELSFIADREVGRAQRRRLEQIIYDRGLITE
jgi:hypothetical protein